MLRERISAVTTSVFYGDMLAETAKYNRHLFDHFVVVTIPKDEETREVCRQYKLTCVVTEDDKRDGPFSKGRMLERGLRMLAADGWILHMDADIVLPHSFRHDLEIAHLKPETIYGVDRFMVKSWEDWQKLVASGWVTGKFYGHPHVVVPPKGFEIGARWCGTDGYCPIGFFQLFNRVGGEEEWRGARMKVYPVQHGNSCRGDTQFSHFWDRRDRELLPEFYVAHLESEMCKTGTNWNGRKTKRFGPPLENGSHPNHGIS